MNRRNFLQTLTCITAGAIVVPHLLALENKGTVTIQEILPYDYPNGKLIGDIVIDAPLIFFNVKNANDRMYVRSDIEKQLPDLNKRIAAGQLVGEMTDYKYPAVRPDFDVIHIDRISHSITNIKISDTKLTGDIKFLSSQRGTSLKHLYADGLIVFRPRIIGSVNEDGIVETEKIIAFDAIGKDKDSFKDIIYHE